MRWSPIFVWPLGARLALVVVLLTLTACEDDTVKQLQTPLEGIAKITFTGDNIEAACAAAEGETFSAPKEDIKLNILGIGDTESMKALVKKIDKHCADRAAAKKREKDQVARIDKFLKDNGLKPKGESLDDKRAQVCEELALTLPKGDARQDAQNLNKNTYGCEIGPAPQGEWVFSHDKKGRWAKASLEGSGGELSFRCKRGDFKAYATLKSSLKKRSKARYVAGKSKSSFRPKLDKKRKTLFFPSARALAKALSSSDTLSLSFTKSNRRAGKATFETKGFDKLTPVIARYCRI